MALDHHRNTDTMTVTEMRSELDVLGDLFATAEGHGGSPCEWMSERVSELDASIEYRAMGVLGFQCPTCGAPRSAPCLASMFSPVESAEMRVHESRKQARAALASKETDQ